MQYIGIQLIRYIDHTTGYILRFWVALWLENRPIYGNFKVWPTFWPRDLLIWPLTSQQWYIHVRCYITYVDQDWWWLVKHFDQYLWDSEQWHFHFKMNIEGWDSEVTLWRHRPPDQCQKYFFLGNFRWFFRIFGQH